MRNFSPTDTDRLRARERPVQRALLRQIWRHLGFLHWPVEPRAVAALLPPGLSVDTFDGAAYVGVVPFTVARSRVAGTGLPTAPAFHELNVRTYVHRQGTDPGVWFFSLDAASFWAVVGARVAYGLPYFPAQMSLRSRYDVPAARDPQVTVTFASRRRGLASERAFWRGEYGPVGPVHAATAGTLEFFLLERYRLYSLRAGSLRSALVHHAPYPIQDGVASSVDGNVVEAANLPPIARIAPIVHYAQEVNVDIFSAARVL